MAATMPVYLSVGRGEPIEIGKMKFAFDGDPFVITRLHIAAALRAAAVEYERRAAPDDAGEVR